LASESVEAAACTKVLSTYTGPSPSCERSPNALRLDAFETFWRDSPAGTGTTAQGCAMSNVRLLLFATLALAVLLATSSPGTTQRVSVASAGNQANDSSTIARQGRRNG
jgi:hypothetical protein